MQSNSYNIVKLSLALVRYIWPALSVSLHCPHNTPSQICFTKLFLCIMTLLTLENVVRNNPMKFSMVIIVGIFSRMIFTTSHGIFYTRAQGAVFFQITIPGRAMLLLNRWFVFILNCLTFIFTYGAEFWKPRVNFVAYFWVFHILYNMHVGKPTLE